MPKLKTLEQTVTIPASPKEVYEALMHSKIHAKVTDAKATISSKVGGKITAYDGYITGKNKELILGKRIVQEWRASDWPKGATSTVTFSLSKVSAGTRIKFTHKNIPSEFFSDIKQGWEDFYWKPLQEWFSKKASVAKGR